MLQSMRKSSKSWVMGILFGFLILSFAVWGIGDIFRGGQQEASVAQVGDLEITQTTFIREYQRQIAQVQQQFGGQIDAETLNNPVLGRQVAASMAERIMLDLATQDLGIVVSDQVVSDVIQNDPNLQPNFGGFNYAYYEQIVRNLGYTVAGYEANMRRELGRARLMASIGDSAAAPTALTEELYKLRSERRVAEVLRVPAEADSVAEPDQAAIENWHKGHSRDFMAPEYRAISAIVLRPEDLMKEIQVPEDQLRESYESRQDEFTTPEMRTASQLVFSDEAGAKKAHELVTAGKSLAEAAAETGNPAGVIELGALSRRQFLPELVDSVFLLQEGGYSAPLRSPLGWHVIQVTKIEPGGSQSFEQVRDQIADGIKREQAIDALYGLITKVEDELSAGSTMDEAGKALNVPVTKVDAVDARGNGPDGTPLADLPTDPDFLRSAFATGEGLESDLVETASGAAFILRVDGITAPAVRPLDQVRGQVIADWKADQARQRAAAKAEELADAIKGGRNAADVAAENGLEASTTDPFTRDGAGADLPRELIEKVFAAARGEVVTAEGRDSALVARVADVLSGDPAQAKGERDAIGEEVSGAIAEDLVIQLRAALRQRFPIELNQAAIDRALQPNYP
ncbi:MAG: SurA N-terminal domain-containing protein [Alphaproteobacteria bacterium]|nr:SurA N-terminal domain-containing protein [Alphaproteobacteria bacterium]